MSGESYSLVLPNGDAYVAEFSVPPRFGDLVTRPDGPWVISRVARLPNAPRPVVFVERPPLASQPPTEGPSDE